MRVSTAWQLKFNTIGRDFKDAMRKAESTQFWVKWATFYPGGETRYKKAEREMLVKSTKHILLKATVTGKKKFHKNAKVM